MRWITVLPVYVERKQRRMVALRIAVIAYPPYVYTCAGNSLQRTTDCRFPGVESEIAAKILEILNVTYQVIFFNDSNIDYGTFINGSDGTNPYSGLLGLLYNGTFDMILPSYQMLQLRMPYFRFSYPIGKHSFYFVVRKSEISLTTTAALVLRTFSPALWGTILAALIFLASSMFFSQNILILTRGGKNPSFRRTLWGFYRFTLNQDHEISSDRKRSMSAGLIFVLLSISSFVIVSMYQGSLLSRLLINREAVPFDSLENIVGLIEAGRFNVIQNPGMPNFFRRAQKPDNIVFEKLGAAFKANPPLFESNVSKVIQLLKTENYVYPMYDATAKIFLQNNCELVAFTGPAMEIAFGGHVFRKGMEPFVQRYSNTFIEILPYLITELDPRYEQYVGSTCAIEQKVNQFPERALAFQSLAGLFLLILSGSVLSLLVFAAEKAFSIQRM